MPDVCGKNVREDQFQGADGKLWKENERWSIIGKIVRTKHGDISKSKEGSVSIDTVLSIEIIIGFVIADAKIADDEQPDEEIEDKPECENVFFCFAHVVSVKRRQVHR